MNGMGFLDAVSGRGLQVVMMSAYGTTDTAVEALGRGAADYISKPFRPDEIRVSIERLMERDRSAKRTRGFARPSGWPRPLRVLSVVVLAPSGSLRWSRRSQPTRPPSSSTESPGREKKPGARTPCAVGPRIQGVRRGQLRCDSGEFARERPSATSARSPGLFALTLGCLSRPTAARCCWMRSVRCPSVSRRACCVSSRPVPCAESADRETGPLMSGWSRLRRGSRADGPGRFVSGRPPLPLRVVHIQVPAAARARGGHPALGGCADGPSGLATESPACPVQ